LNATVIVLFGWALAVVAGSLGATALAASGFGEFEPAKAFLLTGLLTAFFAAALIIGFRGRNVRTGRAATTILMLLIWFILPAFAALPFFALQTIPSISGAYFEAVSGLTTTGATVIEVLDDMPRSIILWRAVLQGIGGGLTLLTAVLLLAPFDVALSPVQSTVPGYEEGDLPKSVMTTAKDILPIYLAAIMFCFAGLWISGLPANDAIIYALTSVSTGGFTASDAGISAYNAPFAELVLCIAMLVGATSFLAHRANLIRLPAGGHGDVPETRILLIIAAGSAVVLGLITLVESVDSIDEPISTLAAFRYGAFRAISLITTTGLDNAPASAVTVPFVLVLALIIVGGAAFSTSGGIKIFRVSVLLAQAHRELKRLIHPHAITRARAAGKSFSIETVKPVWSLFFVFLFTAGLIALAISFQGETYETALMAALATLSNAGPAMGMALGEGGSVHNFAAMTATSKLTLSIGMVLGRLEILALLGLTGWWWHNRL
jgi:trk system potassium uptake protein TrkH